MVSPARKKRYSKPRSRNTTTLEQRKAMGLPFWRLSYTGKWMWTVDAIENLYEKGYNCDMIAEMLHEWGFVESPKWFKVYVAFVIYMMSRKADNDPRHADHPKHIHE